MTILDKITSRKFIITVAVGFVVVFGKALGINLSEDQLWQLVATGLAYIGAQGTIDFKNGK